MDFRKMLSNHWMPALLLAAAIAIFAMPAAAQLSSGQISGVVKDSQGGVIPGATIIVINQAQGAKIREMTTSGDGTFVATPLPPATYSLTVEVQGFKKYTKTDIVLSAQERVGLPTIVMEVGGIGETVTVEANPVTLQTVSAERSGTITNNMVVDLATSARGYADLLKTVAGINADTNNVNGTRVDQNAVQLDGVATMDTGNNGMGLLRINPDIISEFKVMTNGQQAEFGRAAGANITIVTKSGTKDFHGTGYVFIQNEWMNANSWINNYNARAKGKSRNSTSGFTAGGPVYIPGVFNKNKDKLFFFLNFEWQRPAVFETLQSRMMPTEAERNGDFSATQESGKKVYIKDPLLSGTCSATDQTACFPNNKIPSNRWNAYGVELMKVFPLPNALGKDNTYNYQYEFLPKDDRNDKTFRFDYYISNNWRASFRMVLNERPRYQSAGLNVNNVIGISPFLAKWTAKAFSGNLTTIIGPTMTNEFNYGNSRNRLPNINPPDSKYLRANTGVTIPLLYPEADAGNIPNMVFDTTNPPTIVLAGIPYTNLNPTINYTDNLTKIVSGHTLKFGIYIEESRKTQTATVQNSGRIYFNKDSANPGDTGYSFANMLLGNYQTFEQANRLAVGKYHYRTYEWFAQDNWKFRPNISIDYGMRFSVIQPWFDDENQVSGFDPAKYKVADQVALYLPALNAQNKRVAKNPLTGQLETTAALIGAIVPGKGNKYNGIAVAGKDGVPRGLIDSRGVQFGPRFGMAWTPWGIDSKTVVRVGAGVFYERIMGNMIFNQIIGPPGVITPKMYYGNLSDISKQAGVEFPTTMSSGLSPEGKLPTVYNFNLSIQRELPGKILLDVGYVGTQGRHLLGRQPFNEVPFGAAWLPQNQDPTKCPNLATCNLNGDNALLPDFMRPYIGVGGTGAVVAQSGLGSGGFIATFGDTSNYNALQLSVNRRQSKDLTFGFNYTWSKVMGTNTEFQTFTGHPTDHRGADYAVLGFDRTQVLSFNYIYNFPSLSQKFSSMNNIVTRFLLDNWQMSGITTMSSGAPTTISYSVQGTGTTALNRQITGSETWGPRPVLTGDMNLNPGDRTMYAWINTSVIQRAVKGSTGMDSGLRPVRLPGVNNWDISFFKKFQFTSNESRYIQLRWEMYNAFNHTQFNGVNTAAQFDSAGKLINLPKSLGGNGGNLGFGAVTGARNPRTMQLAVKLIF
jgi:hypothetical protein